MFHESAKESIYIYTLCSGDGVLCIHVQLRSFVRIPSFMELNNVEPCDS